MLQEETSIDIKIAVGEINVEVNEAFLRSYSINYNKKVEDSQDDGVGKQGQGDSLIMVSSCLRGQI